MNNRTALMPLLAAAVVAVSAGAGLCQEASHSLTIRDHQFHPNTLTVKAGTKVRLTVTNAQKEAAEFESAELNREKVIPPGSSATIYIGPLQPGSYGFFDDFHQSTKGQIVAK